MNNIPYFVIRVKYSKTAEVIDTIEVYYNKNQALAKHYSYIGADMEDDTLSGSSCTVLNQLGENVINENQGELPQNNK